MVRDSELGSGTRPYAIGIGLSPRTDTVTNSRPEFLVLSQLPCDFCIGKTKFESLGPTKIW